MEWWQLVVPALSTLVGVWLGAWFQAKTSLALLKEQNHEAERVRQEQATENARVRVEARKETLAMHLIDEKRIAYANFLRLVDDSLEAAQDVAALERRREELEAVPEEERPLDELRECLEESVRANRLALEISQRMIDAMYTIYFLAPKEVSEAVDRWSAARDSGNPERIDNAVALFRKIARQDLGIPVSIASGGAVV